MKIAINGEILEVSGGGGLPEGTVAVKPLTKAEYDALTDEEKQADVVYAITDDGSSGDSGSSSEEIYSTEETRIGTWIDGKPLYRKIIIDTLPSSQDQGFTEIDVIPSFGVLIRGTISIDLATAQSSFSLNQNVSIYSGGIVKVKSATSAQANSPFILILEYTKTTDTGGTT